MQTCYNLVARIGGAAAVVGGLLWSAKAFHDRNDAPPWPTDVTDELFFVVPLLFLVGITGLYARCRGRLGHDWGAVALVSCGAGLVGLVGSVIGWLTMTSEVGPRWWLGISWWMFLFGFLEVLKLLDSDLSNREISARLFVSLATIKSHTKHLYRKLGVNARHQAIVRGKELGLL